MESTKYATHIKNIVIKIIVFKISLFINLLYKFFINGVENIIATINVIP